MNTPPSPRWSAKKLGLLLCLFLGLGVAGARPAEPARIAVFEEPGFLNFLGWQALAPKKITSLLENAGFKADLLNVKALSDPASLSGSNYAAVVLPYGNAFPIDAYPALKQFHQAGGVMVLSGIPFTHPTVNKEGDWKSRGGENFFGHDAKGIGTGGFTDPDFSGPLQVATPGFVANPLGLTAEDLPETGARSHQCLKASSLPPEDEVLPLIEMVDPATKKTAPVSALIKHGCKPFHGAIDIWTGVVASELEETHEFLASQLLLRGLAVALQMKGTISPEQSSKLLAHAGTLRRPSSLPGDLDYKAPAARETFVPKSNPPARQILAVNLEKLSRPERIALGCLQALTSRKQPRIWVISEGHELFWLKEHIALGQIDSYELVEDWRALFEKFRDEFKGAIIPDANLYRGDLLAVNVAGCEDLIVCSPGLAKSLGIPVTIDLRGRFKKFAEGLSWVWETYGPRMNHALSSYTTSEDLATTAFAYEMQWRAPLYWVAGSTITERPGVDRVAEKRVVARILSEMEPNGVVLGFPEQGDGGVGLGEPAGVDLISRYGQSLICSNYLPNLCVTSGVTLKTAPALPPAAAQPALDRSKVYVALAMSDGDNQHLWQKFWKPHYFEQPRLGEFPLAFGIGPAIIDLQPVVLQWYFKRATPGITFISDVSGIGYTHPDVYGTAYKDRQRVSDGFLAWTDRYLERMGIHSLRTVSGSDELLSQYLRGLPGVHSLFGDMGRYSGREGIAHLTYLLEGKPVFRSVTSWRKPGATAFIQEIREQVGKERPAFVNGFIHCWTYSDMGKVAAIYDARDADMVFVTPAQLTELYLESIRKKPAAP